MADKDNSVNKDGPAGPAEEEAQPVARRGMAVAIFMAVVVLGLIGGYLYWRHARQFEDTDDAFIDGSITPLSAKVPGIVLEILVQDNQDVVAGTVLVKLDPRDLVAKLEQARASYGAAQARLAVATTNIELVKVGSEATLAEAKAGVEREKAAVQSAESQLASVRADAVAADADANRRTADLKRFESLDRRVVSQQQLDAAKAAAESAIANLDAANKRVMAADSHITEARAKVVQAEAGVRSADMAPQQVASAQAQARTAAAAVEQSKAELSAAELYLSYGTIKAPVSGRVARKSVQLGQYMQVGQSMMAIVQPDVWVTANFKETQLTRMHVGQAVELKVDAYPGQTLHGTIQSIQAGTGAKFSLLPPENATGNYVKVVQRVPVKIVLDPAEKATMLLAPGMSVVPVVRVGETDSQPPAAMPGATTQQVTEQGPTTQGVTTDGR